MQIVQLPASGCNKFESSQRIGSLVLAIVECVANSIDAECTTVTVLFHPQQLSFTVQDDGQGICGSNFDLLFSRNATSKVSSLDDLNNRVHTLGFKGEALADIAQLASSVRITSKASNCLQTMYKEVKFGEKIKCGICVDQWKSRGTLVEVSQIFHNIPVRRIQALQNCGLVGCQIVSEVMKVAYIRPQVEIVIKDKSKGVNILHLQKCRSLYNSIEQIFGEVNEQDLRRFRWKAADGKFKLNGFIVLPPHSCPTSAQQLFYVNSRCISNDRVKHIVNLLYNQVMKRLCYEDSRQGQEARKRDQKFVGYFMNFHCPPNFVDVTSDKSQAEFHDFGVVEQAVKEGIKEAWGEIAPEQWFNPKFMNPKIDDQVSRKTKHLSYKQRKQDTALPVTKNQSKKQYNLNSLHMNAGFLLDRSGVLSSKEIILLPNHTKQNLSCQLEQHFSWQDIQNVQKSCFKQIHTANERDKYEIGIMQQRTYPVERRCLRETDQEFDEKTNAESINHNKNNNNNSRNFSCQDHFNLTPQNKFCNDRDTNLNPEFSRKRSFSCLDYNDNEIDLDIFQEDSENQNDVIKACQVDSQEYQYNFEQQSSFINQNQNELGDVNKSEIIKENLQRYTDAQQFIEKVNVLSKKQDSVGFEKICQSENKRLNTLQKSDAKCDEKKWVLNAGDILSELCFLDNSQFDKSILIQNRRIFQQLGDNEKLNDISENKENFNQDNINCMQGRQKRRNNNGDVQNFVSREKSIDQQHLVQVELEDVVKTDSYLNNKLELGVETDAMESELQQLIYQKNSDVDIFSLQQWIQQEDNVLNKEAVSNNHKSKNDTTKNQKNMFPSKTNFVKFKNKRQRLSGPPFTSEICRSVHSNPEASLRSSGTLQKQQYPFRVTLPNQNQPMPTTYKFQTSIAKNTNKAFLGKIQQQQQSQINQIQLQRKCAAGKLGIINQEENIQKMHSNLNHKLDDWEQLDSELEFGLQDKHKQQPGILNSINPNLYDKNQVETSQILNIQDLKNEHKSNSQDFFGEALYSKQENLLQENQIFNSHQLKKSIKPERNNIGDCSNILDYNMLKSKLHQNSEQQYLSPDFLDFKLLEDQNISTGNNFELQNLKKEGTEQQMNLMILINQKIPSDYMEIPAGKITQKNFRHFYLQNMKKIKTNLQIVVDKNSPNSLDKQIFLNHRILNQINKEFIVLKNDQMVAIVDQHAADERVQYEKLMKQVFDKQILKVHKLKNIKVLNLSKHEQMALDLYERKVSNWGWSIQYNTKIQQYFLLGEPSLLDTKLSVVDLKVYLHQLLETSGVSDTPEGLIRILKSKACRSAVMFGRSLNFSQAQKVIKELSFTEMPMICAHGRPTVIPLICLNDQQKVTKMEGAGLSFCQMLQKTQFCRKLNTSKIKYCSNE